MIKPCPNAWCKSTDIVDSHDGADHKRYMKCDDCNLQGPYGTQQTIVELWNAMASDHVSKSELRAWCEEKENHHKYYDDYYQRDVEVVYLKDILEKFCKGEES